MSSHICKRFILKSKYQHSIWYFKQRNRNWKILEILFSFCDELILTKKKVNSRCQILQAYKKTLLYFILWRIKLFRFGSIFSFFLKFSFWAMKYQWTRLSGTISILRFFKHYMCQTDKNSLAATISKLFDDVTEAVI